MDGRIRSPLTAAAMLAALASGSADARIATNGTGITGMAREAARKEQPLPAAAAPAVDAQPTQAATRAPGRPSNARRLTTSR